MIPFLVVSKVAGALVQTGVDDLVEHTKFRNNGKKSTYNISGSKRVGRFDNLGGYSDGNVRRMPAGIHTCQRTQFFDYSQIMFSR